MKKLGLSAFFVKGYPQELLEHQTSAEQLEQALDKHIKPSVQEYFNLMNEFFETVVTTTNPAIDESSPSPPPPAPTTIDVLKDVLSSREDTEEQ